ncbi:MAG: glycoside hydrolase family 18 protein [Acidobacteriaceae bacterium]
MIRKVIRTSIRGRRISGDGLCGGGKATAVGGRPWWPHNGSRHLQNLFAAVALAGVFAGCPIAAQAPKRLVAYYLFSDQTKTPSYTAKNIPFKKLTHLIHVALVVGPEGDGQIEISKDAIERTLIPRAHRAKVRVLVCVQGAASSFRSVAADPAARLHFAAAVKKFIEQYDYDGVDIDWEVPQGASDVANDVALMQALRAALPRPRYLISMATPSEPGHWGDYDFRELTPIVDFYNVMTYDFHGPWVNHAGHNSPLFLNVNDPGHDGSIDDSMNLYLNQLGVPAEKINLGTAFYGYESPASELYAACACEKSTHAREYGSYIEPRVEGDGWKAHVDALAMAPYLTHEGSTPGFITYDDAASTARKVVYALQVRNLGGVFMWELSGDFDGKKQKLLDSMFTAFKQSRKR